MNAYSFAVLRYIHDPVVGEFLNVGVAMLCPEARFVEIRCRQSYSRISGAFTDLEGAAFNHLLSSVKTGFETESMRLKKELPLGGVPKSIMDIATKVLPLDDSALQWSPMANGITMNPEDEIERLFTRFVGKYDEKTAKISRSDTDVWHIYKNYLEKRNLLQFLSTKTITAKDADDEIEFQYAYKNGKWNCLEPISLDLVLPEKIREKAYRWLGHITSIQDSSEEFKIYFLLGEPHDEKLKGYVEKAVNILNKIPNGLSSIIRESEADDFAHDLAEQLRTEHA